MPSSSSAKKVARVAARSAPTTGGSSGPVKQRNWLFPLAIVAIIAIGIGAVVLARGANKDATSNSIKPRAQVEQGKPFDHWHAAFAINVCGTELPATPEPPTDTLGIHTHGDGLIHIHPFTVNAGGKQAKMGKFWDLIGLKVTDNGFQLPPTAKPIDGGRTVQEGKTTCDGKPGELVMAYWKDGTTATSSKPDKIYTSNFPSVRFTKDLSAYTLAYVAKGDRNIPAPSSAAEIKTLGACDGANPPPSCSPGSTKNTVPSAGGSGGGSPRPAPGGSGGGAPSPAPGG